MSEERFPGFVYDDEGENISCKNRSYCELTAQYWAWKNVVADYYGFFHYRRFLYPDPLAKYPYRIMKSEPVKALEKLGYSTEFAQLIQRYDWIMPKGENMYVSVQKHYAEAMYHHERDLELAKRVLLKRCPQMESAVESYLSGTTNYFGNIYIMRRKIFFQYCTWLFPLLEEIDRKLDISQYSQPELRVDGYLAERLLGVYYTYYRNTLKTLELPKVHFVPNKTLAVQMIQTVLPPGTRRRALIKKLVKG